MKLFRKTSLSRISSGMTAVLCSCILINAILTNNGGEADSQAKWQELKANQQSFVGGLNKDSYAKWRAEQDQLDQTVTQSISELAKRESQSTSSQQEEPSLLTLIRENADVAPSVSSGTDRVSVVVKPGDTLFAIALRHGLKVTELARLNGLEEPYTIRIGETLYVAR